MLNAITDAFRYIASHDFPDRWPALPDVLGAGLRSGEPCATLTSLRFLRVFSYHYAMKRVVCPLGGPMGILSSALLPTALSLAQYLMAHAATPAAPEALHLLMKTYFSAIEYRLATYPATRDPAAFVAWCGVANSVLQHPAPPRGGADDDEETLAKTPWWEAKKWAAKIIARVTEKYGNPRELTEEDPEDESIRPLVTVFNKSIAPEVVSTVLGQLVGWAVASGGGGGGGGGGGAWLSARVRQAYLCIVANASDFSSVWRPLRPHMSTLIAGVIVAQLRPTQTEIDFFQDEPEQWLLAQDDFLNLHLDPSHAAEGLLRALADKRQAATLPIADATVARLFAEAEGGGLSPVASAGSLVAALRMLNVLAPSFASKKRGRAKGALEGVLARHVTPALAAAAPPLVRVRAMQCWSACADAGCVSDAVKAAATAGVLHCLGDTTEGALAVRQTAAGTLAPLIAGSKAALEVVRPHVAAVVGRLFSLLGELGSESVVSTLSIIVEAFDDSMPELAGGIAGNITATFAKLLDGEDGEDGDAADERAATAERCLEILQQLMDTLYEKDQEAVVIEQMFPHIWPLLARLLDVEKGDTTDYLDNALSLLGGAFAILEGACAQPRHAPAWGAFVAAQRYVAEHGVDWAPSWAYPTDAAISNGAPVGAFHAPLPSGLDLAVEVVSAVEAILVRAAEDEALLACRITTCLLHYARGGVDRVLPRLIAALVVALSGAKTAALRSHAAVALTSCLAYNAAASAGELLARAEAVAGGAGAFVSSWFGELAKLEKPIDIKIASLGLACLIGDVAAGRAPGPLTAGFPALLALSVTLLHREEAATLSAAAKAADQLLHRASRDATHDAGDDNTSVDAEVGGDGAGGELSDGEGEGDGDGEADDDGSYDDEDGSDVDWGEDDEDDDPETVDSPLNHVNSVLFFARTMTGVMTSPLWASVAPALSGETRALLQACAARAESLHSEGKVCGELGPGPEEASVPAK